ncbi:hypothetical protein [Methylobacterium fujisawaense]
MRALDLSTIDPLGLALAAETAARASLNAAGIIGGCTERATHRATVRAIEHGQAMADVARFFAFVAEHYEALLPVLVALQEGSVVAVEEAPPMRRREDGRAALALVCP